MSVKAQLVFDSVGFRDGDQTTYVSKNDLDYDEAEGFTLPDKEFARLEKLGAVKKFGAKTETAEASGWPGTHDEIDTLANDNGVTWPEGTRTIADKVAALEAAGVSPPSE